MMPDKRYAECKRFVVGGLLGLAAGSVLLLARKFSAAPALFADLSVLAGGGIVLCSNSCIIYGLLLFAGKRGRE
ncbi:MAG: hypothetical protein LBC79_00725 [Deltaproteobacteria bacterium]|jgi:hypothetical protein|nr:hypothetical protein [Deltaproteobacteria bacterium]